MLGLSTPPSRQTRGERTRAALVRAAAARFQDRGFDKATTGEIARDAGVAEGTLFLHFGSKTGLLLGVMESFYQNLVEELAEEASRGGTAEARLRHLVFFWLRRVHRDWSLMRVFGQHGRFSDDPEMIVRFAEMNRKITRFFGGIFEDLKAVGAIRSDLPTYVLRDALFGAAEHLLIGMDTTGRERDLREASEHLCDLLLGPTPPFPPRSSTSERGTVGLEEIDAKLDRLLAVVSEGATQTVTRFDGEKPEGEKGEIVEKSP